MEHMNMSIAYWVVVAGIPLPDQTKCHHSDMFW